MRYIALAIWIGFVRCTCIICVLTVVCKIYFWPTIYFCLLWVYKIIDIYICIHVARNIYLCTYFNNIYNYKGQTLIISIQWFKLPCPIICVLIVFLLFNNWILSKTINTLELIWFSYVSEISTVDSQDYKFNPLNFGALHFTVKASNDAHIALTAAAENKPPKYEVPIYFCFQTISTYFTIIV